jgi:prophage DNA circulation protein
MGQAQGAIDAARAAGADKYAVPEYTAATTAMTHANEAVAQRDYRLALNHALDSREHAQNAARDAAQTQARIRGEVERAMAEVAGLMAQANLRLAAAEKARVSRTAIREAHQLLARVDDDVQKAGEALSRNDYVAAQPALDGIKRRIQEATATLDTATVAQSQRRRR